MLASWVWAFTWSTSDPAIATVDNGKVAGVAVGSALTQAPYNAAIARAFREGGEHPFYYDTVWDVRRLVDYLKTRKDVDPKRIGLLGIWISKN